MLYSLTSTGNIIDSTFQNVFFSHHKATHTRVWKFIHFKVKVKDKSICNFFIFKNLFLTLKYHNNLKILKNLISNKKYQVF